MNFVNASWSMVGLRDLISRTGVQRPRSSRTRTGDSDTAWKTAALDQAGDTADAVETFFKKFVGKNPPPSEVGEDETLMANLPVACRMLANACDAYADHVETAEQRLPYEQTRLPARRADNEPRRRLRGGVLDGHALRRQQGHALELFVLARARPP